MKQILLIILVSSISSFAGFSQACTNPFSAGNNGSNYLIGGQLVNVSYSATVSATYGFPLDECGLVSPADAFWVGRQNSPKNSSLTLNFSAPLNDVHVLFNVFSVGGAGISELFTITTNGGNPILTNSLTGCTNGPGIIAGNVITANSTSNSGILKIHAPQLYTSITLVHDEVDNSTEFCQENGTMLWFCFSEAILPITISSFYAKSSVDNTALFWRSETELNGSYYDIEFSDNGRDFISVGRVKVQTGQANPSYSFNHKNLHLSKSYYRLKMVDIDGHYKYSTTVIVSNRSENIITVGPNPVTNRLTVNKLKGNEYLSVYNSSGQQIVSTKAISNTVHIDTNSWAKGVYLIVVYQNGIRVAEEKIVK